MYQRVDYLGSRPSCVGRNVQRGLLRFCRLLTGGTTVAGDSVTSARLQENLPTCENSARTLVH
ncbi:MAG: hypothetical protein FWH36_07125 [Lentimicrobiaceae bacterium]|nr:hypothetical protein [Lentimicrobiaceae bacterium]